MTHRSELKVGLSETYERLLPGIKKYIPDSSLSYLETTNRLHCDPNTPGGSKFTGVDNIFQVLELMQAGRLEKQVNERQDDRSELMKAGAPDSSFLPAKKDNTMPADLPEALYYKVDGIEGELGIEQLGKLSADTKVIVKREKGNRIEGDRNYAPASLIAVIEQRELPKTDFATVIIGRDPGTDHDDLWTIHPGPPIRPSLKDFPWSKDLAGPEDKDGVKGVIITTVGKLMEEGMSLDDYIKISRGRIEEVVGQDTVVREI